MARQVERNHRPLRCQCLDVEQPIVHVARKSVEEHDGRALAFTGTANLNRASARFDGFNLERACTFLNAFSGA